MANVGRIEGTLQNYGTSAEVEIGGAKWSLFREHSEFEIRCFVDNNDHVLWSCTARGDLTVWGPYMEEQFLVWSDSFDYGNAFDGCDSSDFLSIRKPVEKVSFKGEITVIKIRRIDLSSPTNEAIESPEDAACIEVEGMKLWVSKKVLSFHSPFFKALFSDDFKEKATESCALKEVKINEFKRFLSVLYNIDITIKHEDDVEELLRLGDMWQCDAVLRFCRFTLSLESIHIRLDTKIGLCDRYGFWPLLRKTIENADLEELKRFVKKGYCVHLSLSSFGRSLIENRLADSR
uniref:BTB domain-containing protein n=1 Tax=Steinernema glaseri TaxID=37863 RepID=A0A1I8AR85_9BILA